MPNQSTPEIDRLREAAWSDAIDPNPEPHDDERSVDLSVAIQAVRDTEARAFREVVEALRDQADMLDPSDCLPPEDHYPTFRGWQGAAQFIERTFLSPDNPEGNA